MSLTSKSIHSSSSTTTSSLSSSAPSRSPFNRSGSNPATINSNVSTFPLAQITLLYSNHPPLTLNYYCAPPHLHPQSPLLNHLTHTLINTIKSKFGVVAVGFLGSEAVVYPPSAMIGLPKVMNGRTFRVVAQEEKNDKHTGRVNAMEKDTTKYLGDQTLHSLNNHHPPPISTNFPPLTSTGSPRTPSPISPSAPLPLSAASFPLPSYVTSLPQLRALLASIFSPIPISSLQSLYKSYAGDNELHRNSFSSLLSHCMTGNILIPSSSSLLNLFLQFYFSFLDLNNDDLIDYNSFLSGMILLLPVLSSDLPDTIQVAFSLIDRGNSGYITPVSLYATSLLFIPILLNLSFPLTAATSPLHTSPSSSSPYRFDAPSLLASTYEIAGKTVRECFGYGDTNTDGLLSLQEFRLLHLTHPSVLPFVCVLIDPTRLIRAASPVSAGGRGNVWSGSAHTNSNGSSHIGSKGGHVRTVSLPTSGGEDGQEAGWKVRRREERIQRGIYRQQLVEQQESEEDEEEDEEDEDDEDEDEDGNEDDDVEGDEEENDEEDEEEDEEDGDDDGRQKEDDSASELEDETQAKLAHRMAQFSISKQLQEQQQQQQLQLQHDQQQQQQQPSSQGLTISSPLRDTSEDQNNRHLKVTIVDADAEGEAQRAVSHSSEQYQSQQENKESSRRLSSLLPASNFIAIHSTLIPFKSVDLEHLLEVFTTLTGLSESVTNHVVDRLVLVISMGKVVSEEKNMKQTIDTLLHWLTLKEQPPTNESTVETRIHSPQSYNNSFSFSLNKVSSAELVLSLTTICGYDYHEQLMIAFGLIDVDHDHHITRSELIEYLVCVLGVFWCLSESWHMMVRLCQPRIRGEVRGEGEGRRGKGGGAGVGGEIETPSPTPLSLTQLRKEVDTLFVRAITASTEELFADRRVENSKGEIEELIDFKSLAEWLGTWVITDRNQTKQSSDHKNNNNQSEQGIFSLCDIARVLYAEL